MVGVEKEEFTRREYLKRVSPFIGKKLTINTFLKILKISSLP